MTQNKIYTAIGLMSGTSLDGIDVARIKTDGRDYVQVLDFASFPYNEEERDVLRGCLGKREDDRAEQLVTSKHIAALQSLSWDADIIGFHGQTIFHDPAQNETVQIGDGKALAVATGIDVVSDFRSADMAAGGQGAPLLPLYHQARVKACALALPVAILNLGGVGNVTWLGRSGCIPRESGDHSGVEQEVPAFAGTADFCEILAFDCGPGNALIDDFVKQRTGADFDDGGALARSGQVDFDILQEAFMSDYFSKIPPKSLDRDAWGSVVSAVQSLSDEDGAATLSAFSVGAVSRAAMFFPSVPKQWFVCGGGRHNQFMMKALHTSLGAPVQSVEALGWNGDGLEAEGFAYLAVRSAIGLPLSAPSTTGVLVPQTGGVLHRFA